MTKLEYMSQEEGFLGIKENYILDVNYAKVVIIPFGMEVSSKFNTGTRTGPRAIIRASHELELFDEEYNVESYKNIGIATLNEDRVDYNAINALNKIEDLVELVIANGQMPVILGGEHSLTAGAIRPFIKKYDDLVILHFDSHTNLKELSGDNQFSGLSSIRNSIGNHSNISKVISCGIRSISRQEKEFIDENDDIFEIYYARDVKNWDANRIAYNLRGKKIYLTFDLSGFDSSLMPATGMPEPGGFFWQDAMNIIKAVAQGSGIVGADIVELSPISFLHSCDILAAKLTYKMLGHIFNQK